MTTQYAEEQGFKKKYLAPLIVLMLCAVSLTGAAYAYSTTVTGGGDIDGDYISIDMYTDDKGTTVQTKDLTSDNFKVWTKTDRRTSAADTNLHAYVDSTTLKFTTYVKVASNIDGAKFTLDTDVKYTAPSAGGDLHITDAGITVVVSLASDSQDTPVSELEKGEVYKVVITVAIGGTEEFGAYATQADLDAAVEAFNADNSTEFAITFTASKTA